jgi:hypothetical protein
MESCAMGITVELAYVSAWPVAWYLVLPTLRCRDGKWMMQPTARLRRLWATTRAVSMILGLAGLAFGLGRLATGGEHIVYGLAYLSGGVSALALATFFTPRRRRAMHALLFDKLHADDKSRAAAMVAAMTGGIPAAAALETASSSFRAIPFDALHIDDFRTNDAASRPAARPRRLSRTTSQEPRERRPSMEEGATMSTATAPTRTLRVTLGGCDAFVSHSWSDAAEPKFAALASWAATFTSRKGRTPLLWIGARGAAHTLSLPHAMSEGGATRIVYASQALPNPFPVLRGSADKFSIDQQDITSGLASLPVSLAGCKHLVCLMGPTYLERLWYVLSRT